MPKPLALSDHTINAVNELVGRHDIDDARERKGAPAAGAAISAAATWFTNFGLGLSLYLPYLYQTWRALAAKGLSGLPSVQVFAAEFDLVVNGMPLSKPPESAPVTTK
jgi:hypothetical protein